MSIRNDADQTDDLGKVAEQAAQTSTVDGRVFIVHGEPGIGKSTYSAALVSALGSLSMQDQMFVLDHEELHNRYQLHPTRNGDYERARTYIDGFVVAPKTKPQPSWQDRQQQSRNAKAALIAKLKKG
jgi:predicted ATP-dependent serine protease